MTTDNYVDLGRWELGEVIGIVDSPQEFTVADKDWKREVAVVAVAVAAGALTPVPIVPILRALRTRGRQSSASGRPSHVGLMALKDARKLVDQDQLFFAHGEPRVGETYARHPLRPRDYLPFADFHRLMLHEKAMEAARYLLALGASDIEITCSQADGKQVGADLKGSLPTVADVTGGMGFGRDDKGNLSIRISGAGRVSTPPTDLIWPGRDSLFKLAQESAGAGAREFHVGIAAVHSTSVNADLAVQIDKLKLGIGGKYKRWEDLHFTVDARFPEHGS